MTALQDMQGSEGENCLVKEAKKWAAKAAKDYKIATHGQRVSRTQNHNSVLYL